MYKKVRKVENRKKILDLHNAGLTVPKIAEELSYRFNIIRLAIRNAGLIPLEDNNYKKDEIINLYKSNNSVKQIIKILDLDAAYIYSILLKTKTMKLSEYNGSMLLTKNGTALCSKCGEEKEIFQFPPSQGGKYRITFCYACRHKQIRSSTNKNIEKFFQYKINKLKSNKKNVNIDISYTDLLDIYLSQNKKCFYTGEDLDWGLGKGVTRNTLSIDRLIPENGYVKENIVLCIYKANTVKNDLTLSELKEWTPSWYKKIERKLKNEQF
jgi:hypothetical protein